MGARVEESRRKFIRALFCFGSLGVVRPAAALVDPESRTSRAARRLTALLADWRSARTVGKEYLRAFPHEADVKFLVESLSTPAQIEAIAHARYARADMAYVLGSRQRSDFECHRTVNVRGCILSRTECRLCALCTLV